MSYSQLIHEEPLARVIARDVKQLLDTNDRLLQCSLELIPKSLCHLSTTTAPEKTVLMMVLVKSAKTFRAMNILAAKGFGSDAMILLRTLTELLVTFRFIRQRESVDRARRYFVFATVANSWKTQQSLGIDPATQTDEQSRRLCAQAAEAKRDFGEKWWTRALQYSDWAGNSLRKKAVAVELSDLYDKVYSRACEASHGSDIASHVKITDGGDYIPEVMPSAEWVEEVLTMGNRIFAAILWDLNAALKLSSQKVISEKIAKSALAGGRKIWDILKCPYQIERN